MIKIKNLRILGSNKVLPGESFILNVSALNENIKKLEVNFSYSIKLVLAYNYDLTRKDYLKKDLTFDTSKFKFKNNLSLKLKSDKLEENEVKAFVKIRALNQENKIIDSEIFGIDIIKPIIHLNLLKGTSSNELKIELKKVDSTTGANFKGFEFNAKDLITNKPVKIRIVKFTLKEYIENLDFIPLIFDWNTIFKKIIFESTSQILLSMNAVYTDILGNEYRTNVTEITLNPAITKLAKKSEKEFTANPIFYTVGFEPALATA